MHKFKQKVKRFFPKAEKAQAAGKRTSANKRRQVEVGQPLPLALSQSTKRANAAQQASEDSDEASKEGAHALRDREQARLDREQPLKDEEASKEQQPSEDDEQASEAIYNGYSGFFPVVEVYPCADSKRPEGSQKHKTL